MVPSHQYLELVLCLITLTKAPRCLGLLKQVLTDKLAVYHIPVFLKLSIRWFHSVIGQLSDTVHLTQAVSLHVGSQAKARHFHKVYLNSSEKMLYFLCCLLKTYFP